MKILNIDIEHHSIYPWQFMRGKNCYLRLRTTELVRMVTVVYGDPYWFSETGEKTPVLSRCILSPAYKIFNEQFYSIMIPMHTHKLRYYFIIELMNGEQVYLSEEGVTQSVSEQQLRPFFVSYVYESDYNIAPIWAQNFVWYQIFPDRFKNDNGNVKSENFIPTRENFYGGTLKGIKDSIPYLKELGVQGVYLNPIFLSDSNHRYDTRDYSLIDSGLGDEMAFRELVNALHKADMRIMLDGVFNHCSWNHPFWQDVRTKGKRSRYINWFYVYDTKVIHDMPMNYFTDQLMKENPAYECFAFAANMPKWNTENPEVISYLIDQADRWTRTCKIDAWRLDVPDEVSPRFLHAFMEKMQCHNTAVYIIGEIWQSAAQWLGQSIFHGAMDYPLYFIIRDFALLQEDSLETFATRIGNWYSSQPESVHVFQWAFCSNHDVARALYYAKGNLQAVKTAYFLTAVLGGNLSIYYGDEIAMNGGEDPDNRRPMLWNSVSENVEFREYLCDLIKLKKEVLYDCKLQSLIYSDALYLHYTAYKKELCVVITEKSKRVGLDTSYHKIFGNAEYQSPYWNVDCFSVFLKKTDNVE